MCSQHIWLFLAALWRKRGQVLHSKLEPSDALAVEREGFSEHMQASICELPICVLPYCIVDNLRYLISDHGRLFIFENFTHLVGLAY